MAETDATQNEWTIMFYFGSDNELSLLNISQIKAVKEAGYQRNTELLLYFDSNETGVPSRLFNINKKNRGNRTGTRIGDGKDPFVTSFLKDQIFPDTMDPQKGDCTKTLCQKLNDPDSMTASESLINFIGYCVENKPAKHYILFLCGHGLIVGNDSFLLDAKPRSGIGLVDFGKIIGDLKKKITDRGGEFELLCLHSCSMSGIEVASELKNTAKYMIASQGFSYVGSWPYRQLMKKVFNVTEKGLTEAAIRDLTARIFDLSLYNAPDFAFSGYSHDLTLCSLAEDKIAQLVGPLRKLTDNLKWSLKKKRGKQLILLAHLEAQSFWREDYTDIFDFCRCLYDNCDLDNEFEKSLATDCQDVMKVFADRDYPFDGLVVFTDNFGWQYRYARGLSIYFPWTRPLGDVDNDPLKNYGTYAFSRDLGEGHSWLGFLQDYWDATVRQLDEVAADPGLVEVMNNLEASFGKPSGSLNKPGQGYADSQCICPSIKNFPTTVKLGRRTKSFHAGERTIVSLEDVEPPPDRFE
jgi:hypothetical protein